MFFDLQSMQPEEITRGIQSANKYIDEQMRPADFVSIVSLSNQLNVDQDFTSNKEDLKTALDGFDPDSGNGFEDTGAAPRTLPPTPPIPAPIRSSPPTPARRISSTPTVNSTSCARSPKLFSPSSKRRRCSFSAAA